MTTDIAVEQVVQHLLRLDPDGSRTSQVLRETFDQIYDGQRTGRFSFDQLAKTERTHIGSLVEINLQRHFNFEDGNHLDFTIAGHDVDAKYSMTVGGWMIPIEAQGKLCMLLHANDAAARWNYGVVRADLEILGAPNRDQKRSILSAHLGAVRWLFKNAPLPENTMLLLSDEDRSAIASYPAGSLRVAELMRRAEGRLVNRSSIEAAAQQKDSMKRVRANGGAADMLAPESYLLFGGTRRRSQAAAASLALPVPTSGTFVPLKVAVAEPRCPEPTAVINGIRVRKWRKGDPVFNTASLTRWLNAPSRAGLASPDI
ncbi:NaeI family type II restriction endonuclease [Micromonospora tulbaghiae]|uniref:NaeI family type II restriction endonuclease n=1 Tax=Micromonospora tulbaghiae TaxID=479978 RepID=UPI0033C01CFD